MNRNNAWEKNKLDVLWRQRGSSGGGSGGVGPPGPPGPVGATGPQGPQGVAGTPGTNASVLRGVVEVTLPSGGGVLEHTQTVAAEGVTTGSVISVSLAPHNDVDENSPELLDLSSISATPLTNQLAVTLTFATRTSGVVKLAYVGA